MGLTELCLLAVGWAVPGALHAPPPAPAPAQEDDPAHAEMRAAGRRFGAKVAQLHPEPARPGAGAPRELRSTVAENIRREASRWSERLRGEGLSPRLVEDLVTTWAGGAHEAAGERLGRTLH